MSLFLADRLTGIFFGLPVLDRIESPTAAITKHLFSNLGVDLAPAATHTLAIAANALALSPLRPALAGCRGPLAGCCACLCRLPQSSCRRRLCTGQLTFTSRVTALDASVRHCRLHACTVSIAGPSSPSLPETSPTMTPWILICVPSSRT
jgi:hypothetical protein